MNTFVVDDVSISVPLDVVDLPTFRQWAHSDEFPEQASICFFRGEVWIDMSKEQIFSHNQVKNEIAFAITALSKRSKRGRYYPDGILLTHPGADLSCQPDGVFILKESMEAGRVRFIEGAQDGFVELEGSPDLVVEIVSRSSIEKDTEILLDLYWLAEIREYWLVDARGPKPRFTLYQRGVKGFVASKKQDGWLHSRVLEQFVRLIRGQDERGDPEYSLEMR